MNQQKGKGAIGPGGHIVYDEALLRPKGPSLDADDIQSHMSELSCQIDYLEEGLCGLYDKLGPVLRPPGPELAQNNRSDSPDPRPMSQLSGMICIQKEKVKRLQSEVEFVMDRLEL